VSVAEPSICHQRRGFFVVIKGHGVGGFGGGEGGAGGEGGGDGGDGGGDGGEGQLAPEYILETSPDVKT